jgi:hypothetical protein
MWQRYSDIHVNFLCVILCAKYTLGGLVPLACHSRARIPDSKMDNIRYGYLQMEMAHIRTLETSKTSKVRERIMATAAGSEKTPNVRREFLLKALRIVSLLASVVGWFWAALYLAWGSTDAGKLYYKRLAQQVRRLDCVLFFSMIRNIS